MHSDKIVARTNYSSLLKLLAIAILLPMFFDIPGAFAGLVLGLMVSGWLVVGRNIALQNRPIVIGLAVVVVLVNALFAGAALS